MASASGRGSARRSRKRTGASKESVLKLAGSIARKQAQQPSRCDLSTQFVDAIDTCGRRSVKSGPLTTT